MKKQFILFAANLKWLRKLKNITQDELALKIKCKRSVIGSYEEGRAQPTFETLILLSQFFGVTIDVLIKTRIQNRHEIISEERETATQLDNEIYKLIEQYFLKHDRDTWSGLSDKLTEFVCDKIIESNDKFGDDVFRKKIFDFYSQVKKEIKIINK